MRRAILLLLCGATLAQVPTKDEQATQKLRVYLEWRRDDVKPQGRMRIIRELGGLDTPTARKGLLKILKLTRSRDEIVIAILAAGRIARLDTVRSLVARVARKPEPPFVEALADSLACVVDPKAREWLTGDAFKQRKPEILYAIAMAQEGLADPDAAARLIELYDGAKSIDLQYAAIRGLGALDGEGVQAKLSEAAKHEDWRVRLALAHAPTHAKQMLDDPSATVRQTAADTCARLKIADAVEPLIRLVEADPRLRTRHDASKALKAISGKDFGLDAARWKRWRKQQDGVAKPGTITVARYYNFGVYSDRVLFVVDISGSMRWSYHFKPKRIEVARKQLDGVLRAIDKKSLVNLMVYSDKVRIWQKKEVVANGKNIQRAIAWAEKMLAKPEGNTHIYTALEKAFAHNPEFDTIYFLSDGSPSDGRYISPEGIVYSVRAWNRYRRARINTIALTLENVDRGHPNEATSSLRRMKDFMRDLARHTGGETTAVASAPRE